MAEPQSDKSTIDTTTTTDVHNQSGGDIPAATPDDVTWQNFKITKSTDANDKEHDFKLLLETPRKSILGDTWICTEKGDKYYLDRAVLASKSNYLARLSEGNEEVDMGTMVVNIVHEDNLLAPIIEIMYGKDLKNVICESNFVDLLKNMCHLEMQIDLDVFKEFIEETIIPKEEICEEMINLYFFLLSSRMVEECRCDYLLPAVSRYLSDRILKAFKIEEFLSMPYHGLLRILLHRNEDGYQDKGLIGRICAQWICHDFEDRVVYLVKLVNATKHRYGIFRYCGTDEEQSIIDSLKEIDENLRAQEVKKCFNEMLRYHCDSTFDCSQLADEISDESQNRIINVIDLPNKWATFLEKGRFCDVIIDVQGFPSKLHRIKLLSASPFFYDLFTENSKSSDSKVKEKSEKSILETHTFDEVDAAAFEKIIHYIYKGEIEITSQHLIINLLKASEFLRMDELYGKCCSWLLDNEYELTLTGDVFDLFHFLCENERHSDLYDVVVKRILGVWPDFEDVTVESIPLNVLKEMVALPELSMSNSDEIVNLCSKWIFHDVEKRFCLMYELAKAINRNFATKIKPLKVKLEKPENSIEYSIDWVKESLIEILSSTALVSINSDPFSKSDQKPRFIGTKADGELSIMDVYFTEIVPINLKGLLGYSTEASISIGHQSATVIDDKLFILFNVNEEFYFTVFLLGSKKFISLATDVRMNSSVEYVILNCNDEVYYFGDVIALRYCFHLNRWISFWVLDGPLWFASDGNILFSAFFEKSGTEKQDSLGDLLADAYDFKQRTTDLLPDIPVQTENTNCHGLPVTVNVIKNDLCILFKSKTFFFHWKSQTWTSIDNLYEDFYSFTQRDQNILYISAKNGAQLYSPIDKKWVADQKLDNFKIISAIHTIMK